MSLLRLSYEKTDFHLACSDTQVLLLWANCHVVGYLMKIAHGEELRRSLTKAGVEALSLGDLNPANNHKQAWKQIPAQLDHQMRLQPQPIPWWQPGETLTRRHSAKFSDLEEQWHAYCFKPYTIMLTVTYSELIWQKGKYMMASSSKYINLAHGVSCTWRKGRLR